MICGQGPPRRRPRKSTRVKMTGEVRLDDGKYRQMAFRTQQNRKNQVLGWLRRNFCSLDDGTGVRFPQTWRLSGKSQFSSRVYE